ncbi:MAG: hypothetical protein Q8R17_01015 [bacterium]|nr:hypothetical protein [bacterium]
MPEKTQYIFARSEQSIFSEIYFPKHAAYQGTIFDALEDGYSEKVVKDYMTVKVSELLTEFKDYPALFDPNDYANTRRVKTPVSITEALKRIEMYKSPFKGWSIYSVDGVFFDDDTRKMYEEAVQVVRIMFRFNSSFADTAAHDNCSDVLRCILFSVIARQGRLYEHKLWGKAEERWFIASHEPWPKKKRVFVEKHFADIAREVNKWIDDRSLFMFAYLVRQFGEKVLAEQLYEKEIWVTNLFDQNLNVIRRLENSATQITQK